MMRYDHGIITQDVSRQYGTLSVDEIDMEQTELRRKAEALAQRTILENHELREMVNEVKDENKHLRDEIYDLQDKINRQVLQINKLEKREQQQLNGNAPPPHDIDDAKQREDIDVNAGTTNAASAKLTLLENFELRKTIEDLQAEMGKIKDENYDMQDQLNRQVLQINKLSKRDETLTNLEKKMYSPNLQCQNKVTKTKIKAKPFGLNGLFRMCSTEWVPADVQKQVMTYDIGFLVLFFLFWLQFPNIMQWADI